MGVRPDLLAKLADRVPPDTREQEELQEQRQLAEPSLHDDRPLEVPHDLLAIDDRVDVVQWSIEEGCEIVVLPAGGDQGHLAIRQQGGRAAVEEAVQQIDILPTVLAACGVEPPGHLPGRAFSAEGKVKEVAGPIYYRLHAGKDAQRFGQGQDRWANILGVHYGGWDFHQCLASNPSATIPPLELFQVLQDPQEQFNKVFKCLGPQAFLQHLLTRASWSDAPTNNNVLKLEDQRELEQQLRSLQYVR